ncbi:MAG: DciA family protein [Anderseniella sp.]|nr:DciA family protein [Anderseniella sp.]
MDSLDKHFRQITRPAFERYGFAHGELVAQWAEVVGEDLAARCSPEKMSWPKGREAGQRHAEGATLTVKCDHGAGLALSYETARIVQAVNAFYGYQAVQTVKVVQGTRASAAPKTQKPAPPPADVVEKVGKRVGDIEQPDLKAALTRLGQAALTKAAKTSR